MVTSIRRFARAATILGVLLGPHSARAQQNVALTIELGTPPTLRVDLSYLDPVALFPRLAGTAVFPVRMRVRNISAGEIAFDPGELRLRLGAVAGDPIERSPMDQGAALDRLRKDARMSAVLKVLSGPDGGWETNPYEQALTRARLKPDHSKSGYVFFERPSGFVFNGFMTLRTSTQPPELLTSGVVGTSPRTRSLAVGDAVFSVLNRISPRAGDVVVGRPFEKSYALLLGISTYADASKNLEGPARDIARMKEYLEKQGFDNVVTLNDQNVTETVLRNVQDHIGARLGPSDRLLVYYAGHGERAGSGEGYLVLSKGTKVPMRAFMDWLRDVKVKHLLVFLDACYAGTVIGGTTRGVLDGLNLSSRQQAYRLASNGSRYVITAGAANQLAYEDRRWDGGLFTAAILRGLTRKWEQNLITTHGLYSAAKDYMTRELTAVGLPEQTPLIQDLGYGSSTPPPPSEGEFIFVAPS